MDAFFGAGPRPGAAQPARRGRNATIRVELDLSECAFGTPGTGRGHGRGLPDLLGEGTAPGTHPETCEVCGGRGEVSQVTRSFLAR